MSSVLLLACSPKSEDAQQAAPVQAAPAVGSQPAAEATLTDDEARAARYQQIRTTFVQDPATARGPAFAVAKQDLQRIANEADDVHLRANASILLGGLFEARGDVAGAVPFYRHAAALVPDDAGPHMALATALAAQKQHEEAAAAQAMAAKLDPDNLENWLVLGQLHMQAGDAEAGKAAYIAYEQRRKGLIDGLTLKRGDAYAVSVAERIACAEALASATDPGTAVALLYALHKDPEPSVRATVANVMGLQRFVGFREGLEARLAVEQDQGVREAIAGALAEIARDPVEAQAPAKGPLGPAQGPGKAAVPAEPAVPAGQTPPAESARD